MQMMRVHAPEKKCCGLRQPDSGRFAPRGFASRVEDKEKVGEHKSFPLDFDMTSLPIIRPVQAKLAISQPSDRYEQEADRVAEQVMRMPEPRFVNRSETTQPPLMRQPCPKCKKKASERDEDKERLQMKPLAIQTRGDAQASTSSVPPVVHEVLRTPGRPLDPAMRAFMEPRFGYDFSKVRVHLDARAAESARVVNARAYTVGRDVVFGSHAYAPTTAEGRRLLAHELTHTIQQSNGRVYRSDPFAMSAESNGYEKEANMVIAKTNQDNPFSPYVGDRVFQSSARENPGGASKRNISLRITPVSSNLLSKISIRDCSATSTPAQDPQEVQVAHDRALEMLRNAITLSNSPDQAVVTAARDFFKITVPSSTFRERILWNRVLYNLDRIVLNNINQIYKCEPQQDGLCSPNTYAWTALIIHLCPLWWTSHSNINHRAAKLIHEWIHASGIMWSRRRDIYCSDTSNYANLTSRQLVELPDAYMQYIYRLYTGGNFCP